MSTPTAATRPRRIGWVRLVVTTFILGALVAIWALFIRGELRAMEVDSSSMEPALLVGDRVFVRAPKPGELTKGAIITLIPPDDNGPELVKRIVAVPGETVAFRDGYFRVNGNPSPPPAGQDVRHPTAVDGQITLGADQYYVLGDNREKSHDSEEFGPIPRKLISGLVIYRYAPRARMGAVE